MSPPAGRPRRLFLALLALPVLFLLTLYLASRSTAVSSLFAATTHPSDLPPEIFGLLHFVTSPDEANRVIIVPGDPMLPSPPEQHDATQQLTQGAVVVPEKPVALAWYALGSITKSGGHGRGRGGRAGRDRPTTGGWGERLRTLRTEYPLVVFSKSYCPYSKRAKKLLASYNLSPPPKIIEVDLRADGSHIKTVLARLTHHATFPNVILNGRSLGGSDDLIRMHEEDELRHVLQESGVGVGWSGEGGEEMLA